jgi:hypothetical protein
MLSARKGFVMAKGYFFRKFDGWWYAQVTIDGARVQRKLVKGKMNEKQAEVEYIKLRAELLHGGSSPLPRPRRSASPR